MATRCTDTTDAGVPCKAWAVRGTDPPRCAAHGGTKARPGAPTGNTNAVSHGFYQAVDATTAGLSDAVGHPLDDVIRQLQVKLDRLSHYIDAYDSDDDPATMIKLINLHSQAGTRLARLLERQQATGDEGDALMKAINAALDEVSEFLDIKV